MQTHPKYNEQLDLERDQIAQGLKRLRDNTMKLENKSYASATIYGINSIDTLMPVLVARIQATTKRVQEGHTGRSFKEIKQYLADLEPLASAAIACKITFDKVFSYKEGSNIITNICDAIGNAVEDECQIRHYERTAPGLFKVLKDNYWHQTTGTHQKIVSIQTVINRYDIQKWESWGRVNRVKLGTWLLDCITETSGWFERYVERKGRRTINSLIPTADFLDIKDKIMEESELFSPLTWPMLLPPRDWSNKQKGGYLLNEIMKGHDMVRRGDHHRIQGETPIAFLNKIQKVGYQLNTFTVNVAEQLCEKGIKVGKFIPIVEMDLPPKPPDMENKELKKAWRKETTKARNFNAGAARRAVRTLMTLKAVDKFKGKEFFIPWSFDYRGRAYPIPAFLTPQDTDFGKSLIRFSNESVITDKAKEWLAFQCATTYGLDKSTWEERLQWTKDNSFTITRVADDPIRNRSDWEGADEPWQFLAACDEYYHCCIMQDRNTTGLPVATDATCSGLQILAGLARDKETATLVNVLPSARPQDAYKVVAEVSKWNIPDRLRDIWDRKCVKRTVMTIPYNAKPFSNRTYIKDALLEKNIEIDKDELTQTVKAVRDAMAVKFPGPMSVMKWIEDEVAKCLDRGMAQLGWVTPSGFIVDQRIMKKNIEVLDLKLLGRQRLFVATDDTNKPDRAKHKAATAPNLIHSLDASLLHLSVQRFDSPIALIHDSVLCRATDMSILSTLVRETYMELFAKQDYLTDFAQQINAESEPPIINTLHREWSVIDSTYFFC